MQKIMKQYFFLPLIISIMTSFCADNINSHDDAAHTDPWKEYSYCPELITPALNTHHQGRDESEIISQRQHNSIWHTLQKTVAAHNHAEKESTATDSDSEIVYCIKTQGNDTETITFDLIEKECTYQKIDHITSHLPLLQEWKNPEKINGSLRIIYEAVTLKQKRILTRHPSLSWGLCKLIELNAPTKLVHTVIKKNLCNEPDNLCSLEVDGSGYTYSCTPLHASVLRYALKPSSESKSIIVALIKSGASLNSHDTSSKNSTHHTPLELLTNGELETLIKDECAAACASARTGLGSYYGCVENDGLCKTNCD